MMRRLLKGALRRTPLAWLGAHSAALTYHTCYATLPAALDPIDNVPPQEFYRQLEAIGRRFRIVPVDEYCAARDRRGLAAITFDDGNKSVIECALPALEALGAPFAVFVNTLGVQRRVFWRLKALQVMRLGLVRECEASFQQVRPIPGLSFHQYTKHARNNSIAVEREISAFLEARGAALGPSDYYMDSPRYFAPHPLLWLGNHTANHYVLASLEQEEQTREIAAVDQFLAGLPALQRSQAFAAPFGEERHINDATLAALRDLGYRYLLVNRGGLNRRAKSRFGIEIVERFSALNEDMEWQLRRQSLRRHGEFVPAA